MGKNTLFRIGRFPVTAGVALCFLLALSQQGCSSSSQSTDPAEVRAAVAEAGEQERQLIQSTIANTERQETFLTLVDQRDAILKTHVVEIDKYRADFATLNADYDAERADFESLVAQYNGRRELAQQKLVHVLSAMKNSTSQEEWGVISTFQNKNLHPRDLAYGGGLSEEE